MHQERVKDYDDELQLNDLRQHAVKIIHGIKKIGPSESRRAIWELFQNAIDLSEKSEIEIQITEDEFIFSHNGIPFTTNTLDCLLTQVSSKTLTEVKIEREDSDLVGQYGTGFMTTHSFGNVVKVSGALLLKGRTPSSNGSNCFIPFENLALDRSTQNWKELSDNIISVRGQIKDYLRQDEIWGELPKTTFRYDFQNDSNKNRALEAIESLNTILPYVITFNRKLQSVVVTDINGVTIKYAKKGDVKNNGTFLSQAININNEDVIVNYIKGDKVIIALPLNSNTYLNGYIGRAEELPDSLSRLFLYYPLIGSEKFGFNFVLHSKNFLPTEQRDGLYLSSDNVNNELEEEANQKLLQEASDLIFNFLDTNLSQIKTPHHLAQVNFSMNSEIPELHEYFTKLKENWLTKFKRFPFVETDNERISAEQAFFLDSDIVNRIDDTLLESIYNIAVKFYPQMPKFELTKQWVKIIDEWNSDDISRISFEDIADKIAEKKHLDEFNKQDLLNLYNAIIQLEQGDIFSNKAILPNIKGGFRRLAELNQSVNLTSELIEIADIINPDISKRQVHVDFLLGGLKFEPFGRRDFMNQINISLSEHIDDASTSDRLPDNYINNLIRYAGIVTSIDSESAATNLVRKISSYYKVEFENIVLATIDEDDKIDVRTGQNALFRVYLNDISNRNKDWVKENINALTETLFTAFRNSDIKKIFTRYAVYPNQLYELVTIENLMNGSEIEEFIKDLYDKVLENDYYIRSKLAHPLIEDLYDEMKELRNSNLTREIERQFYGENESDFHMERHKHRREIIDILNAFKEDSPFDRTAFQYQKFFPVTFRLKSTILVQLADGETSFKILSQDEDKIRILAELAEEKNLDELIRLGKDALRKKEQEKQELLYKKELGEHLEKILQEHLAGSLNITVASEQDGQDLIIYSNDEPVYYIEVKSRWLESTSYRISKNQTIKAFENQSSYALCTVNMVGYNEEDRTEVESIFKITDRIKFNVNVGEQLGHLIPMYNSMETDDEFRLDGDLRTYVPMPFVRSGRNLSEFESFLINYLKQ